LRTSDFDPISTGLFSKQVKKITLFVLLIFGVLVLRLWFLQIVNGSMYRTKSEQNRIRLWDILPLRGMILDRKGEILVDNRPYYDLYLIPEEVQDREKLFEDLNRLLDFEPELANQKLDEASRRYPFKPICLKKNISRDELALIETRRYNLPGVMMKVRPQRHYVLGNFASHLLGYLGEISERQLRNRQYSNNKPGDLIGKSGVEREWQPLLNGIRGGEQVEVDATGRKIKMVSRKLPVPGANICLTIDKDLQALAEKCLTGKKGAIVAINPNNGGILALASSPSFDPNLFINGVDNVTWNNMVSSKDFPLQNRALSGQYPPGSVFKIIVALAGLEEGIIDPKEEIVCHGVYTLGRHKFHCWKKYGHGKVSLHRAIVESCDIYFYKMGMRLGVDKISRYARMLGLGRITGFDALQEKKGLIPTSDWKLKKFGVPWQGGETVSISIGQSFVLVTPIQMATLISAIFNGGVLYQPHMTKWVKNITGESVYEFVPKLNDRVKIRQENLELIKKALIGVVNEPHGTGWRTKLKHLIVAGKTGTAQVVTLEKEKSFGDAGKVPWKFRDHAWFVAIAPADRPKIALSIVIEHGGHGGSAAAPIAKEMIEAYLEDSG
jgi:penicillin-binding protein 2